MTALRANYLKAQFLEGFYETIARDRRKAT